MDRETWVNGIKYLRKVDPYNNLLDDIEKQGYTTVSRIYLETALAQQKANIQPYTPQTYRSPSLEENISTLIAERSILSNSFHDCTTDQERKTVSIKINNLQDKIKDIIHQKKYFEKNGKLPPASVVKEDKIPTDPVEILKMRNNLRCSISRVRRNLKEGKISLSEANNKIKFFENKIAVLENTDTPK